MVLLSNILYAFLAVWFLAKIYNSESILFGESMSSIKLFERRKNIKKGSLPSVAEGLLVLVVALLLMVYLGGILSLKYPIAGVIIPQLFIGVLPVLACLYIKAEPKKVFRLNPPKPKHMFGAVLMWLGAGSGTLILSNLLSYAFPDSSQSLNEEYMTILEGVPFVGALILIALVPAVCEELMYRGYLFTALKQKMKLPVAIFIVSLLFGISHMSLIKLLPTMLLGVALEQTDSLVNSSLIHFLNNGFAVFTMYYGDRFTWLSDENMGVPLVITMMVLFVVATPLSILCMKEDKQNEAAKERAFKK
jgi:sodium transport system permease protein